MITDSVTRRGGVGCIVFYNHPVLPLVIWGALAVWLIFSGVQHAGLAWFSVVAHAVGALVGWTFFEYLLHRFIPLFILVCSFITMADAAADLPQPKLVEVRRIWDQALHNAFTDLILFDDRWICVFREGRAHVSPDGALRVITSTDGRDWKSTALVTSAKYDLRDAKITVTPKGELMLNGAGLIATAKVRSQ